MKTILRIAFTWLALMVFSTMQAANIELIDVVDTKTFNVSISEVKMWTGEIVWEVKVLSDMSVAFANQDEENDNVAVLTLEQPLEKNTEYSLLTVFGADGSIDFETGDSLEWIEILNTEMEESGQYIESIALVDVNTLEVNFSEVLSWDDLEFKLLSDIAVKWMTGLNEETITVDLTGNLWASKNYIFMVLALQDALSQDVELEEWIFDFTTPETLEEKVEITESEMLDENIDMESQWVEADESWLDEDMFLESEGVESSDAISSEAELSEDEIDLNAAYNELETPEESSDLLEADVQWAVDDALAAESLESLAMSATVTPEAGAETTLLIILTLLINTFYYFTRRKA